MEDQLNNEDRVIMYLEGDMNDDERAAFEHSLQTDPELQQLVEEYKVILRGLDEWGDQNLKKSIREVHSRLEDSNFFSRENTQGARQWRYNSWIYLAAAAVMVGAILFVYVYTYNKKSQGEPLFAEYYKPDTVWINSVVRLFKEDGFVPGSHDSDSFDLAIRQYSVSEYFLSVRTLQGIPSGSASVSNLKNYLTALNYIGMGEWEEAEVLLGSLCESRDPLFSGESCWNLALVKIKSDPKDPDSRTLLQNIINSDSKFSKQAEGLLNRLK